MQAADGVVEGVAPPAGVYSGPPGTVPSSNADKQRNMQLKQQKKVLLDKFAKENHFRIDTIEKIWQKFHTMDDGSGNIDFDQFCSLLEVSGRLSLASFFVVFVILLSLHFSFQGRSNWGIQAIVPAVRRR